MRDHSCPPTRSIGILYIIYVVIHTVTCAPAWAGGATQAAERGLEIAREADRRSSGFGDFRVAVEMILRDAHGRAFHRHLRLITAEVPGDGDRSLITFDSPPDQRGVALLTYSHPRPPDDQWLFLPALKRVKRIVSNNQSGPFVSSEFAFEDLTSQEVERFDYAFVRDDRIGERPVWVVERIPRDPHSGYSRQFVWYDTERLTIERIEYFDRHGRHLKTLNVDGYEMYLGRYWRAHRMAMVNHLTGKETDLLWAEYRFDTGLDPETDFSVAALRRSR